LIGKHDTLAMRPLDTIIFVAYMAGVTLFGASFFRKNRTSGAFTLGNRNIPGWVITMSIFATYVSSISFLALPGSAYLTNWNPFVFSLTIPFAAMIAVKFFVPLYRKLDSPSAYSYMEERFGPWARIYVSVCYLLTQLMRVGTILYLLALTLHAVFGWNMVLIILITGLTIMVYSILGGLQAVVWTDAIQGLLLIGGALLTIFYIAWKMPEGAGQIFRIATEHGKFSLGSFSLDLSASTFWVVLIYGFFINLQNFGIDQSYIQRYMASRSDRAAKKSALSGGLLYIPVSLLFLLIGTALYAFYTSGAATLPAALQSVGKSDQVFPYFIVSQLPAGITGLLIASVFAAGMSTISTSFNSSSTVFLADYYRKFGKKGQNEQGYMKVLYLSSVVITILGIIIALAMINVKSALDTWWKLASVFSGGMLGLFLLGAFTRRSNSFSAMAGTVIGIAVIAWMSITSLADNPSKYGNHFHSYLTIVFGTIVIFLTGFLISHLAGKPKGPV
jgi:solute:Na+ symporter, SSS family